MRDITERRRAENEREHLLNRERMVRLEAEAANRSKDQFLATVSHELRTPLTAILGWASMLRARRFDPERTDQIYQSIERNAQAQAQIIGDLLDVSRIITGQLRLESGPVDLCEIARASLETIRPTTTAKNIALISDIPDSRCLVAGDPARLQQILWNLLSNAAKFTPADGTMTLRVRRQEPVVVIELSDTGIGIAADILPRVFDRFWQADGSTTRVHGGLGLGLALVRHLVELHGGDIAASSAGIGCGSTFAVSLPALRGDARIPERLPPPSIADPATADLRHVTVLVVDNDDETRRVLAEILAGQGADVLSAGSAAEGFHIIQQHAADVIMMDISMPREDGFSLLRRIRAHELERGVPPTPAIAVTAYAGAAARAEAIEAGFAAYIAKPAPPQDIFAAILTAIPRAGSAPLGSGT
jgi:CheY-like chemotaxis protein